MPIIEMARFFVVVRLAVIQKACWLGLFASLVAATGAFAADPILNRRITYQGRLDTNTGQPVTIAFQMENTAAEVWGPETFSVTPDAAGNFAVVLGSTGLDRCKRTTATGPLVSCTSGGDGVPDLDQLSTDGLELEVVVNGVTLSPPQKVFAAFHASTADEATNATLVERYTREQLRQEILNAALPVGTILDYASDLVPSGFLKCNGASYANTQYPDLYAVLGTRFGGTATSFRVPDLRGRFTRGWNDDGDAGSHDPDAGSRVPSNSGGAGGNAVGSYQDEALRHHTHSTYGNVRYDACCGTTGMDPALVGPSNGFLTFQSGANPGTSGPLSGNSSAETRPRNVAVNKIIKAANRQFLIP